MSSRPVEVLGSPPFVFPLSAHPEVQSTTDPGIHKSSCLLILARSLASHIIRVRPWGKSGMTGFSPLNRCDFAAAAVFFVPAAAVSRGGPILCALCCLQDARIALVDAPRS